MYFLGVGTGGNNNSIWLFKRETMLKSGIPYFPDFMAWPLFFMGALKQQIAEFSAFDPR